MNTSNIVNRQVMTCRVLRARIESAAQGTELSLRGEIDLSAVPVLHRALEQCLERGLASVVVDVSDVGFCDCAGLHELAQANRTAREHGREFKVVGASEQLRHLFEIAGARELLSACLQRVEHGHAAPVLQTNQARPHPRATAPV
ncbi:STAS domain-containing protein [Actinospica sp.]|uniref:STAS domain-containing protein n=1 Tax=Actinospica sp. TaxID=1872142 RepID=UPI002B9C6A3A|nr:STAS domain-containing protein [Actinospica sp.]HWG26766.1 STAS domain-containing protein [Actinospica sp.]